MTPQAIAELDKRLADLDRQINDKTKLMRGTAFQAAFSKEAAAGRAKLKEEIAALTVDRDELNAARAQGLQMIEDKRQGEMAAVEMAKRQARLVETKRIRGEARQAAKDLEAASYAFIDAAIRLQPVQKTSIAAGAREAAHFAPRRMLQGIFNELRKHDMAHGFTMADNNDISEVGLGAVKVFLDMAGDPVEA